MDTHSSFPSSLSLLSLFNSKPSNGNGTKSGEYPTFSFGKKKEESTENENEIIIEKIACFRKEGEQVGELIRHISGFGNILLEEPKNESFDELIVYERYVSKIKQSIEGPEEWKEYYRIKSIVKIKPSKESLEEYLNKKALPEDL